MGTKEIIQGCNLCRRVKRSGSHGVAESVTVAQRGTSLHAREKRRKNQASCGIAAAIKVSKAATRFLLPPSMSKSADYSPLVSDPEKSAQPVEGTPEATRRQETRMRNRKLLFLFFGSSLSLFVLLATGVAIQRGLLGRSCRNEQGAAEIDSKLVLQRNLERRAVPSPTFSTTTYPGGTATSTFVYTTREIVSCSLSQRRTSVDGTRFDRSIPVESSSERSLVISGSFILYNSANSTLSFQVTSAHRRAALLSLPRPRQ